jgi:hypothetical protein
MVMMVGFVFNVSIKEKYENMKMCKNANPQFQNL